MKNNGIIIAVVCGIILLGLVAFFLFRNSGVKPLTQPTSSLPTSVTSSTNANTQQPNVTGTTDGQVFTGTLPCADCEGLKTTLVLGKDSNYTYSQDYLGKKVPTLVIKGKWRITKGIPQDTNATLYNLDPTDKSFTPQHYILSDADHLKPLDPNLVIIKTPSSINLTLTRKK